MAGEKTEQPTPKKLRDARKKGQISKSKDLTSALVFVIAAGVLLIAGNSMSLELQKLMQKSFEIAIGEAWSGALIRRIFTEAFKSFVIVLAPLLGAVFFGSLFISYVQAGAIFTTDPLKPELNKLNPMEGFKRMFSLKGIVQLLKSTIILIIVFYIAYQVILDSLRPILLTQGTSLMNAYSFSRDLIATVLIRTAIVMVILGGADFLYQRWQFNKDMMMSKEEVKNEYKQQEGDPHYKAKRKRMHQEIAMSNMLQNARKADVIVVNPVRYAVAIKYDRKDRKAPMVVAKGENIMAEKIRQIAKEEGIPVMRNVNLAQALMRVDVDDVIPENLYEAVAEVLNWVYKMRKK